MQEFRSRDSLKDTDQVRRLNSKPSTADFMRARKQIKDYSTFKAMPSPGLQKKVEFFFLPYNKKHTPYKHMKFDTEPPVNYDIEAIDRQM